MPNKLLIVNREMLKLHPNRILQQYGLDPAQWRVGAPGVGVTGFRAEMILIDFDEWPSTPQEQREFNDWMRQLQTRLAPGGEVFIKTAPRAYFQQFGQVPEAL